MKNAIIGREKELLLLEKAAYDDKSHFIAVFGRRRIGKTFLIREAYKSRFAFQHSGLSKGNLSEQLFAFDASIKDAGGNFEKKSKNWLEAFELLKDLIRSSTEKKKIVFIDELSWMDTPRSNLMMALENFWNGWASARDDIVLIVCTSATSWMLSNIVHNKGGLYNRLTEQIHLKPFSLKECEEYVNTAGLSLNRTQIMQYYMVFGGVPYYWTFLEKGQSLAQNIDRILFSEDAPLKNEFDYLYASIFKNPTSHLKIIKALSGKKAGLSREEIIASTGLSNSGDLTIRLEELENCGFIRKYTPFDKKKKGAIYQLIDFFTLFYYHFLSDKPSDEHYWSNLIGQPKINTWTGLAFEKICISHIPQIKQKLGISGIHSDVFSWQCKADPDNGINGSQIDLIIARKDQIINMCEIKYSEFEYSISDKVEKSIRRKITDFYKVTKTKSAIHTTLITTYGMISNSHSDIVQAVITMSDLFE